MEFWIGATIAAVIGFALGALVVWLIDRKRGGGTSVAALKQEHEQFREQVTTHFVETADLINKLTDSYKDVFDHLSKGAETLVDDKSLRDRMPRVSDQEVRLKRLGSRSPQPGQDTPGAQKSASDSGGASRGPGRGEVKRANDPRPSSKSSSTGTSRPTSASSASGRKGDPSDKPSNDSPARPSSTRTPPGPATRKPPSKP